uniref:Uncharacterized protein n=1 Tax=Panagrolaimus sp. PS1159 TaxID=55785 RepID=A0AC35FNI6_9BILA
MHWIKLLIFLVISTTSAETTNKCTAAEYDKMASCTANLFTFLNFFQTESKDVTDLIIILTTSWSDMEYFCFSFELYEDCLGPSVINLKYLYSCAISNCVIDDNSSCQSIKESINQCTTAADELCDSKIIDFVYPILTMRECLKNPGCDFCDPKIAQKIKQYTSNKNARTKESSNILEEFAKNAQSSDVGLQLDAITKLRKQLPTKKLSENEMIEILPIIDKYLSSKNLKIKSEATWVIKFLADESAENIEIIIESEIIPTLIQTLISTNDKNVLENMIETLATLILKQPKLLRNLYMDLNIVEPLLMSYSSETSLYMLENISQILFLLSQRDDATISISLTPNNIIRSMIPTLSELIQRHSSQEILNFVREILKTDLLKTSDIAIDKQIIDSCFKLLTHQNDVIRLSTLFVFSFISKNKRLIQPILEKGILEIVKNAFKNDFEFTFTSAGLAVLRSIVMAGNSEEVQSIFDADLLPYIILFTNSKYENDVVLTALQILFSIAEHVTPKQITALLNSNIIPALCQILKNLKTDEVEENLAFFVIYLLLKNDKEEVALELWEYDGKEIFERFLNDEKNGPISLWILTQIIEVGEKVMEHVEL